MTRKINKEKKRRRAKQKKALTICTTPKKERKKNQINQQVQHVRGGRGSLVTDYNYSSPLNFLPKLER